MVAEFQAIVLAAGRSSPLEQLIPAPKPLLQLGNFPLIYFPIQWLKKNGFEHVIVVVSRSTRDEIALALAPHFEDDLKIEYFPIDDEHDYGTAESLLLLHKSNKIKTDLLVLTCDLISDLVLQNVANVFRMHNASLTAVYPKSAAVETVVPGAKSKKQQDREIIGMEPATNRLVCIASEADFEGDFAIQRFLLNRYSRLRFRTALQDSHIYLLKRWVLELLTSNEKIKSIQSDLVPFLIKNQHRTQHMYDVTGDQESSMVQDELSRIAAEKNLELLARQMSVWSDHSGDMEDSYFGNSVRCYAFLADTDLCFRVNTVTTYCEASRLIPRILQALLPALASFRYIHHNASLLGKAQVGADSIVGERTVIQDKVSIKKSVIGPNCKISEKAKISGCTIMNDVSIGESCNLQNCIIASQAQIGDKSDLKNCLVGQQCAIPASSEHSNDSLTDGDRLMEYE